MSMNEHQRPPDHDDSNINAEDIPRVNAKQNLGSLFVSQLPKHQAPVYHNTNTKAPTKHNLNAPDLSDFTFAPANRAIHPPPQDAQSKIPSFSQQAGGPADARPHQGDGGTRVRTSLSRDRRSPYVSPPGADELQQEKALPDAVSPTDSFDHGDTSIHSSDEEPPQSEGGDFVSGDASKERNRSLEGDNTPDGKEHAVARTQHWPAPPAHVSRPQYNVMGADPKRGTPEQTPTVPPGPRSGLRYRVHKPQNSRAQAITHNASTALPSNKRHAEVPASNGAHRPSDEDLLMLVIRRQRMRDNEVARLTNANHRLEDEHAQLQSNYKECHQKLQDTTKQWHASVQGHHVQEAQIRAFRDKYSKIKQWARDMSKEYEGLRADGNKLRQEVQAARTDGDRVNSERKELLRKCDAAISQIVVVKSNVAAIRSESLKLASVEEQLAQKQGRLREEELRNKSHALYIERLASTERSMNLNLNRKQDEIVLELTKVAALVKKQQNDGLSNALAQVIEAVERLRQHDAACSSHKGEVQTMLASVEQHYEELKKLFDVVKTAQIDQYAASNLQFSSLADAVDKLKPDLVKLQTLEKESSGLSARLKEAETSSKSTDREKRVAQLFCSGLLQAHKEVVRERSQPDAREIEGRADQLRDTNGRLSIELQSNKKEVANLQNELSKAQDLSDGLRSKLNEQNDKQKVELERVREQCSNTFSARINELETQLGDKAAEVTAKQDELQKLLQLFEALRSKLKELEQDSEELGQRLQERDKQIAIKTKDLEMVQSAKCQLEQYLSPFKDMKDELSSLQQRCIDYDVLAKQVKKAQADHDSLEKNAADARIRAADFEQRLKEAIQQLQSLDRLPQEINSLQQTSSLQIARIKELSDAQRDLELQVQQLPELRRKLTNSNGCIRELEGKLKAAEESATDVAELRDRLKGFQNQSDDLSKAQAKLKETDSITHDLLQQVSALKSVESEVVRVTKESQQKDAEMATMQDRTIKLEEENRRFDPLREHITDEEIAAFSEPIILSLKSLIHQTQSPRRETNDTDPYENDEDIFGRPRRAANRGARNDAAEAVMVPDSQSQGRYLQNATTSELSSPPDCLNNVPSMFNINEASEGMVETLQNDSVGLLTAITTRKRGQGQPELRPGTSNDEMLLRSSDAAYFSPARRGAKGVRVQVLVPASTLGTSPMKTRTGMQILHNRDSTPLPQINPATGDVVNFSSPHTHPREHHAPNSAAKRRGEEPEPTAKRRKADMKRLTTRKSATPQITRFSDMDTIYEALSSSRKSRSTIGTSAPAPGKNRKKTNIIALKGTKHSQYADRFYQAEGI